MFKDIDKIRIFTSDSITVTTKNVSRFAVALAVAVIMVYIKTYA